MALTNHESGLALEGLKKFHYLPVQDKLHHPEHGAPEGLCEIGKQLFVMECENSGNSQFFGHYGILPVQGGCAQCYEVFCRHLMKFS